jgi:hypothetical protein
LKPSQFPLSKPRGRLNEPARREHRGLARKGRVAFTARYPHRPRRRRDRSRHRACCRG